MSGDQCGTYAGWNAHKREGTPACLRCKRAQANYAKARRDRLEHERRAQAFVELGMAQ